MNHKNMILKLISRNSNAAFSRRQVFRFGIVMAVIGTMFGIYTAIASQPVIADVRAYWKDINSDFVYVASSTPVTVIEKQERIDQYADEIFEERMEAYKNDARLRAIDKVQAELEVEKESIRAVELKTGSSLQ